MINSSLIFLWIILLIIGFLIGIIINILDGFRNNTYIENEIKHLKYVMEENKELM